MNDLQNLLDIEPYINGTQYQLTIDDDGNLTTEPLGEHHE